MNLKEQFQEKSVIPSFAAGGFAVTPIIRETKPDLEVKEPESAPTPSPF